jgi:hypothetical protein
MNAKHLHFYADNSAAIQTIFDDRATTGQFWTTTFRKAALDFLDADPTHTIELAWVPGHQDIKGNERSDILAKSGTQRRPRHSYTSLTHAHRAAQKIALDAWKAEWMAEPTGGRFALADRFPPCLKPRKHFQNLPRRIHALMTQVRTGHAFVGDYYKRFVPTEDTACPCGADPQTRAHVLQDCPIYDEHRHILEDEVPDLNLADLFGTNNGISALARFIEASDAFTKSQ